MKEVFLVKTNLLIQVHLPREELFEAVQLLAKVFFDHSKQRDLNVLQLGLQRGELSSLLMRKESNNMIKIKLATALFQSLFTHTFVISHLSAQ